VTDSLGDSIRFPTNESVVDELLRLKRRARNSAAKCGFFIDDTQAINIKRTKSLLPTSLPRMRSCRGSPIALTLLKDEEAR